MQNKHARNIQNCMPGILYTLRNLCDPMWYPPPSYIAPTLCHSDVSLVSWCCLPLLVSLCTTCPTTGAISRKSKAKKRSWLLLVLMRAWLSHWLELTMVGVVVSSRHVTSRYTTKITPYIVPVSNIMVAIPSRRNKCSSWWRRLYFQCFASFRIFLCMLNTYCSMLLVIVIKVTHIW